jgi:hypothetical protein
MFSELIYCTKIYILFNLVRSMWLSGVNLSCCICFPANEMLFFFLLKDVGNNIFASTFWLGTVNPFVLDLRMLYFPEFIFLLICSNRKFLLPYLTLHLIEIGQSECIAANLTFRINCFIHSQLNRQNIHGRLSSTIKNDFLWYKQRFSGVVHTLTTI